MIKHNNIISKRLKLAKEVRIRIICITFITHQEALYTDHQ